MFTFVIAKDGTRLMPTSNIRKVRKQLKSGQAKIFGHNPFTIQLMYETGKEIQPVEAGEDTGYENIGLSIKSEKHEFASREYVTLKDEKKHHASCRKYRRERRNRKRYREPRFNNRKSTKPKDWVAPSLEHKSDIHTREVMRFVRVCPITSITMEMGQFDTQALAAVEKGKPLPESIDYQHGPKYGYDTQREAVFARDKYKCRICKKSAVKNGVILRIHHINYWKGDRSNRIDNLASVCTSCHTPANHAKGGALYGWDPKTKGFKGAAFMNTVKWYIFNHMKAALAAEGYDNCEVHITYGAVTKRERLNRHIEKSHANDAYCIGQFHPKHRSHTRCFEKVRRQNRVLCKFYDSKWIDRRDGSEKKGAQLPNGRTNRNHKKDTTNLRIYRKKRVSKGYNSMQTVRYDIQPGDVFLYKGRRYAADGVKNNGEAVKLTRSNKTTNPSVNSVKCLYRGNGWKETLAD